MRKIRSMQLFLLDLFYPNRCPCCHRNIAWNQYLCTTCQPILQLPEETFCPRCGKPIEGCLCGTELTYDRAIAATIYQDLARSGILSLKTAESLNFAYACGQRLGRQILHDPTLHTYDLIVPIPMAKRKKRKRFLNPAETIAKEIAAITKIPLRTDILQDTETGSVQHTLSAKERAKNTARFTIRTDVDLSGYRILLCDDVLTTGSTMNRCAGLLKEHGAEIVTAVAASSTLYFK